MKKTNSESLTQADSTARKTILRRHPSLKATSQVNERPQRPITTPKIAPNVLSPLKLDTSKLMFYGRAQASLAVTVQNVGKELVRVGVTVPKTKYFVIREENRMFTLSPGMSKRVQIELANIPFQQESYYDQIHIACQTSRHTLELQWEAYPCSIEYSHLVDLKTIDLGRQHRFPLSFRNKSQQNFKIRLSKDPWDSLQLSTEEIQFSGNEERTIQIIVNPVAIGAYHHKIVIQSGLTVLAPIEIVYAAIDFSFRLEDEGNEPVKELVFGAMLRGTRKEMTLYAHNNSPHQVELRTKVKIGRTLRAQSTLQSPQELGIQCSSTVIEVIVKTLRIKAFSRQPLQIVAESKVGQTQRLLVERFARCDSLNPILKNRMIQQQSQHNEILVCQFVQLSRKMEGDSSSYMKNSIVVPMKVHFCLPMLKVLPNRLQIGQITVGSTAQGLISIQNISTQLSCSLSVSKIFSVDCFLLSECIKSRQISKIQVYVKGTNIGIVHTQLQIIIAKIYSFKVELQYEVVAKRDGSLGRTEGRLWQTGCQSMHEGMDIDLGKTMQSVQISKNRSKYENKPFRKALMKVKSSLSLTQHQAKPLQTVESIRNSGNKEPISKGEWPIQITCKPCENTSPSLLAQKYDLFVTKKIDKFQPYAELKDKKLQKTRSNRDYFNFSIRRCPKNRKQAEQTQRQLTPQELTLVSINEKIISFGRLFIRSKVQKEFLIGNRTEGAISVQLQAGSEARRSGMLTETDYEPQIISPQGMGRFAIVLNANNCGKFEATLSYTINGTHCFQLLVTGEIELASLTVSKNNLRMGYQDDLTDILLRDSLQLRNDGNISAYFSISQLADKFLIAPSEGTIKSGETLTVTLTENNTHYPVIQAGDSCSARPAPPKSTNILFDQRILIKVKDGNDISLRVTSQPGLSEPRCVVRESKLQFGCTIVSKSKSKTFQLKNLSRSLCLFEIQNEQCSDFLTFDCMRGRVPPQGSKQITVTYRSGVIHNLQASFRVLIRGGLVINVPIQAQSIAPEVSILENGFTFGQVCCNTAAVRPISVKNESQIAVELFLDLRNNRQRGVQYLTASFYSSTTQPVQNGRTRSTPPFGKGGNIQQEILDNAVRESGVHKVKIQPKSVLSFWLILKPVAAGYYEFLLPIYLQNFIRNDQLTKVVSCQAIEPKFAVEPNFIRFRRKIINDKEHSCFHPLVQSLTLRNPTDRPLRWKLDLNAPLKTTSFSSYSTGSLQAGRSSKEANIKSCFQIQEKRGQLGPKQSVIISVAFNPMEEGVYFHKVPLLIFSEQKGTYQQEAQIRLQGQGKYPSLYFDRRQLILPVVPLGIQGIAMFQVHNQGYETINLKHRFQLLDSEGNLLLSRGNLAAQGNCPELAVVYPQGCKMGINKRQLYIIVKFVARKSISFSCKLQLYDDATDCRVYILPLSATADNSLLTTFSYLADPQNIYKLEAHFSQQNRKNTTQGGVNLGVMGGLGVTLKINDGRNVIDRYHSIYDEITADSFAVDCRIIKRWLNNFFRQEKVRSFPGQLSQNGQLLVKLLHRLTGRKQFDGSLEIEGQGGIKQPLNGHGPKLVLYEQILRILKTLGCLLNHIRPYYLLQRQQFLIFMARDPNWPLYADYYLKKYEVLHIEAWIVLFYQLVQHFWCSRGKDTLRSNSNVYSQSELQVLRWIKAIYQQANELQDSKERFLSYGSDFKDCLAAIFCLLRYSLPQRRGKILQQLQRKPISVSEYAQNTKLLYQLLERLSIVPLVYEDQYQFCHEKEIFLFLHQLSEVLPQNLPRTPPVLFSCELGETCSRMIEIRNPSSKTVHYWVKAQGSRDFQFEQKESVVVQPKGVYPFKVEFKSRLSIQQVAYLTFFSKQEAQVNSAPGSAMVFELRSKITGRKSIKKLQSISCPLYESGCLKVLVQNPFDQHELANFTINIIEETSDQQGKLAFQQMKVKEDSTSPQSQLILEKQPNPSLVKLTQFYTDIEVLKIKRGSSTSFDLYFAPLRLSKTRCYLIFYDPAVGQFQYELTGVAQIPKPLQQIKYQPAVFVGGKEQLELSLPVYNSYMLKCEAFLEQRLSKRSNVQGKQEEKFKLELNMDPKITEYLSFPGQLTLRTAKKDQTADFQNKIRIEYNFPIVLKDLSLDFLLLGDSRRQVQDVRRFRVALNILHRPLQQQLLMTTTARKPISQIVPIDNTSGKDWKLRVTVIENQGGYFSLREGERCQMKQMVVKRGQSQNVTLCFEPRWLGKWVGRVTIHNQTTNQQLIFVLRGIAEQPLSEDHFHIKVNNEESSLHTVQVTNPYAQKLTYRVLSDIEDLQLPPQITLEPNQCAPFTFIAETAPSSTQVGFLKFQDSQGRFFWYSITLECAQKKLRQFWVQMACEVGRQIEKLVQFKNPFNRSLQFKVEYPREVGLEAKEEFILAPHSNHQYKIKFKPFKVMAQEISLKATSKQVGVFLYHIKLTSREEIRRKLHQISAEVGKSGALEFKLENNSKMSLKVNYALGNEACFEIQAPQLLQPGCDNIVKLRFKPATEGKETTTLKIWGEFFPTKVFQVEATGLAPYSIEVINFKAHARQTSLQLIKFSNPNPKKCKQRVKVCLSEAQHGNFRLVGQGCEWETDVDELLVIPIEFQPQTKGHYQSVLTIQCFQYQWKYLLKGSTNFREGERINEEITAINKQEVIRLLKIPIPQYIEHHSNYFNRIEMEHPDRQMLKCLKSWLKLKMNNAVRQQDPEQTEITVYLKFRPRKQIKEMVKLILMSNNEEGPRITYNLQLNVTDCGPQSTIPIQIETIKAVHLQLSLAGLGLKEGSKILKARMAKGAYCEAEKSGGDMLRVKFKPTHLIFNRGKTYTDNLLLESEQQEWNFLMQFHLIK